MSNTKYTNEFKLEVITYYLDNHTVKETLSHYSISESALFAWKRKYDANCLGATNTQKFITINRIESHIEKMQKILDAQKILQCTSASSTAEKVKAIDALSEQFPIRVLCEAVVFLVHKSKATRRWLYLINQLCSLVILSVLCSYTVTTFA